MAKKFILDLELWPQPMPTIPLQCDSEATMFRAFSKIYNGKSIHIALRHEYVRQLISDGITTVVYVKSSNNLADLLTKRRSKEMIKSTPNTMGLKQF